MQRIGVFVCWCGSNIAGTVDVQKVSDALAKEPGVVFSTNYQYMCSQAGQDMIKNAISEYKLTGIVICSCSPRMHETTFRKTAESAGINPYMVEIANIREHCSWIHKDVQEATEKAVILARAAIAKVHLNAPLTAGESPVVKRALVIGGGIAGIQTALDIALLEADLTEIKAELIEASYIKKKGNSKTKELKSKPFHYISSDGFHMYVGKNNYQNDYLTFKLANSSDWWFHSKGVPGSHVVVKSEGRELPDRVYEEAGALAAYYSKGREQDKVEIDYVQKKEVKKPAGAKPGFVVYYTNYSLVAVPDISGLTLIED